MISSDVIRGDNDTIILYLLLEGESYGYEISNGYGALKEKTFRIAHMADMDMETLQGLLRALRTFSLSSQCRLRGGVVEDALNLIS